MSTLQKPEAFWEDIGKTGYANLYSSGEVERNVYDTIGKSMVEMANAIGLNKESRILDIGCGDGRLANTLYSSNFGAIEGYDLSQSAIERAKSKVTKPDVNFTVGDVTSLDYAALGRFDGAFAFGIFHHVKKATPDILKSVSKITDKMLIMEPNGNHILRKLLEKTEGYKKMGEDSFRTKEFETILNKAGYKIIAWKRLNIFPNFTPLPIFRLLKPFEPMVEKNKVLNALCTVNMWSVITQGNKAND